MITASELATVMPRAGDRVGVYLEPLNACMREFAIDNPDRIAAFLAQIALESGELRRVEENLNYSVARLMAVWPTRFRSAADALPYAMQPEKLANFVYANRYGNGPPESGDGWRYRGAGLIQLTFKDNHVACASHFKMAHATIGDWLRTPEGAARSAGWYWHSRGLGPLADNGFFTTITRKINPALEGMRERVAYWERAKDVFA